MPELIPPSKKLKKLSFLRPAPTALRLDVVPFAVLYALLFVWYLYALVTTPVEVVDDTGVVLEDDIVPDEEDANRVDLAAMAMSDEGEEGVALSDEVTRKEPSVFDDPVSAARVLISAAVVILHILTMLACHWSVDWLCWVRYQTVQTIDEAVSVKVVPGLNQGKPEICRIRRNPTAEDVLCRITFEHNKTLYLYNPDKKNFQKIDFLVHAPLSFYLEAAGYGNDKDIERHRAKYGPNLLNIPMPSFGELFQEQALAPFFVFQVFCVLLWCLDEYWYYSIFTLFLLVTFESTVVKARLKNLGDLRGMRMPPRQIMVYRNGKWSYIQSDDLLPGDLCSVLRGEGNLAVCPCDILLLRGSIIADEAMLTGESVPQPKEPLSERVDTDSLLDIKTTDKAHMIFSGTKILQHSNDKKTFAEYKGPVSRPPNGGCLGYVLRTGFQTNQGKLMRMILTSVDRVTANNTESFLFICFLLCFALVAAGYVLKHGLEDESRSRYHLFLSCTLIITSVVPPELPMELSLAVNNSLLALMRKGIFCTEPFRIPFAGKIDVCCFDKTGTLTSDTIDMKGVAILSADTINTNPQSSREPPCYLTEATECPIETIRVLSGCQSLVFLDGKVSGDPMEMAALKEIGWTVGKADSASASKGLPHSVHSLHRYRFSSSLKRMSVVSRVDYNRESSHWIFSKGAPETIALYLREVPAYYDDVYKWYSRQGGRVIALAYKRLPEDLTTTDLKMIPREEAESDLVFAGFAVFQCPLKKDSAKAIKMLNDSSHRTVMITGDHMLTACHVARNLAILEQPELCLTCNGDALEWVSTDESRCIPYESKMAPSFWTENDLCMSGAAMSMVPVPEMISLLPHVRVFARVSPSQKEFILRELRTLGYTTLMCGDGTNDVGALKQAHVGVAILNSAVPPKKPKTPKSFSEMLAESRKQAEAAQRMKGTPEERRQAIKKATDKMMEDMDDGTVPVVRLGDASIASPFTAKMASMMSVVHIVRQGRCTLVTTLEMFKILALNCLITAYSLSVLYLDGVKLGDTQATIIGMLIAMCFLFISRSKPIEQLSAERPPPNIFNFYMFCTVIGQFAVHLCSLIFVISLAKEYSNPEDKQLPDDEFKPNLLNTSVFLISSAMQVATFAINHRGRPFMESLSENIPLRNSLFMTGGFTVACAAELFPDWNEFLELVPLPSLYYRHSVLAALFFDFTLCWLIEWVSLRLFIPRNPKKVT